MIAEVQLSWFSFDFEVLQYKFFGLISLCINKCPRPQQNNLLSGPVLASLLFVFAGIGKTY